MAELWRTRTSRAQRLAIRAGGALLLGLVLAGCSSTKSAYVYQWNLFFDALFRPDSQIREGLVLTVAITLVAMFIGVALGIFAALGKLSKLRAARWIANIYIWIFRGTPLIVQLTFFYYGLSVAKIYTWPDITVGPFLVVGAIQAGIFTLGMNEGAYMAEIVRAGIISIDPGQLEAAKSLGMTYPEAMRRIILPQAARVIVPPLGNEFNGMLKTTSLLFVLSVLQLYTVFDIKQGQAFAPFEYFLACAVWFLLLTTTWGVIQAWIERRFAKGTAGSSTKGPGMRQRLFGTPEPIDPSLVARGR